MADEEKKKQPEKNNFNLFKGLLFWIIAGIILITLARFSGLEGKKEEIIYSRFLNEVKQSNISGTIIIKENVISGTLKDGKKFSTYKPDDPELFNILREYNVDFKVEPSSNIWINILVSTLPILLVFLLIWFFVFRQMSSESSRVMAFTKSRPIMPDKKNRVTFDDVAGCKEAKEELREVIEFLKNPKKFQRLGGKIPKGILLIGPPGTGKTLLAKAVAGEAGTPFLSMSGSDFVEMFVGVGASRIRDLFRQAIRLSPCIIFIDELDAVGRQRFAGLGGGHDEREQTLNQLLVQMDGFPTESGVIVMAATNRPDVLDPALTRPGRFDRTIVIDFPDIQAREEILKVHMRNKPIDESVDVKVLARATAGLSGANLENLVNEAALLAARKNKNKIEMTDFEEAKDKVLMGVERKSLVISEREKKIIAYHEAGHTLIQKQLPEVYPVHKVTIIPRGQALGITHILPEEDRFIESNVYYKNSICALMGGRSAEKLVFNKIFTGGEHDLKIATEIAKRMVCEWGMSENLGPVSYHHNEAVFLGRDIVRQREYSEDTSRDIDNEIRRILEEAENRATEILKNQRDKLEKLAEALLQKETLNSDEIDEILELEKGEEENNEPEENRRGN
ncbi:MAG: ATP-dependent zinc metalloprotease FtsH [Candidatus Omnitrophica bacterium]|nr:ATP-dependent zinc metalloprotease FtsH [Candidatus Omnitrophota bacterium]MCM8777410.1 ATP-dependent zinc metalloprotease FtsH [Candidatus Omnitrophota bacterium]